MQSFLQYRRFRRAVEQQYDRHSGPYFDKPVVGTLGNNVQTPHPASSTSLSSSSSSAITTDPNSEKDSESETPTPSRLENGTSRNTCHPQESHIDVTNPHSNLVSSRPSNDDHLNRIPTHKSHRSLGATLGQALTGIAVRRRKTHEGGCNNNTSSHIFVVGYEGDHDPLNPHNWSYTRRIAATAMIASIGFVVGIASSIDSSALRLAAEDFGVSEVVQSLATGLYLAGFGVGALFAGPFSETLGRNPVYITTLTLYMIFIMAAGLAPNIGALLTFRFLAGIFGSTPLTCAGGSISDLWSPMERVFAFPVFANAAFMGPTIGPVIGGFIAESSTVSWRWVSWVTLIISGLVLAAVVLFQPETYPPTLLKWKAQHLRDVTGDSRYVAEIEIMGESFIQRLKMALSRPFLLTFREPVIMILAFYLTVIYVVLFTFLDGYEDIFGRIHGVSQGITGLCFLGIIVGLFGASALVPLIYKWARRDLKEIQEQGGTRLPPEFRLWFAMLGGAPAIPISLFWMGWTSYSWISIWSPLGASVLFGYGILCIFISSYQYIIDTYEMYAASALASITLIRYFVSGGMTVVGIPWYRNMEVHWVLTIMGGISVLMVPVPYLFYKYGRSIRKRSTYAVVKD
ncbi:major facilitator superfamily domain-containing protein [Dendryphion nanum]|uniref:Major facilitator superfamily domain-containing protein n=1 Tax=Dendryphion nanum TaxID=256645 RepID=A0A9P9J255_9PLEO|nr:major facilitator superfamily domain-containing protein [Dendryphion nanum]